MPERKPAIDHVLLGEAGLEAQIANVAPEAHTVAIDGFHDETLSRTIRTDHGPKCRNVIAMMTKLVAWCGVMLLFGCGRDETTSKPAPNAPPSIVVGIDAAGADAPPLPEFKPPPRVNWRYQEETDKMRGTPLKVAVSTSTNRFATKLLPDEGYLFLIVREMQGKQEVMLQAKGATAPMPCVGRCTLHAKFDDGKVLDFSYVTSERNIFVENFARWMTLLRASKHLIVEVEFLTDGVRQMEFDVDGLVWGTSTR